MSTVKKSRPPAGSSSGASNDFPHLLIRASAGTGKTYQLSNRYLGLMAAGVAPETILATTFTRKAAGEIFDRVLFRLADAATNRQSAKQLAQALSRPDFAAEDCLSLLLKTLARQHKLRIGTLDSYFAQLASAAALDLGLPAGWRIGDEQEDADLQAEAIERVLERGKLDELLALFHLLAKGETKRSVSELIAGNVADLYALFGQTSPEAWNQLPGATPLTDEQFEATLKELESIGHLVGDKRACKAWQDDILTANARDWDRFIRTGLGGKIREGAEKYYSWVIPAEVKRPYQALLDHARSVFLERLRQQAEATYKLLQRFDQEFRALKQERRLLRFDDVTLALAAAEQNAGERLAFRLGGQMQHLLLDEFQDTSLMQWQVLRPLARQITSRPSGCSLFCVGDVKQAIYGWRGGLAEIFGALEQELTGLQNSQLAESRRSAQSIIDVVNQVFQHLTDHPTLDRLEPGVRAWQGAFPVHTTAQKELLGYVTLETSPLDESGDSEPHEPFVAERIAQLARQAPGRSVGVLVRTNSMVGRLIYLLRKLGIPASEEGGSPLADSPAVSLLMSVLQLADHPGDGVCRYHVAKSPLAAHFSLTWPGTEDEAVKLSQRVRSELLEIGYGPVLFRWAKLLAPNCDRRDLTRLQQLIELAFAFQSRSTLRTSDFVKLVEAQRVADPQPAQVRVMTVHQAKGLEFDIVVLPELDKDVVGHTESFVVGRSGPAQPINIVVRSANEQQREFFPPHIQELFASHLVQKIGEALCVLYVSLTRPVHALHMIISPAKPNERNIPKTFAGLLRAALAPGQPALGKTILYQHGEADWQSRSTRKESRQQPLAFAPTPGKQTAPIRLAAASRLPPKLDRVAPSQLEGGQRVPLAEVFRETSLGLHYGTLLHAWFEQIEWLDQGPPEKALLEKIAAQTLDGGTAALLNMPRTLKDFYALLKQPGLAQLLTSAGYRAAFIAEQPRRKKELSQCEFVVECERPFAYRQDNRLMNGFIDRLVLERVEGRYVGAHVMDYKTDDVSVAKKRKERTAVYRPQLEAYIAAVARMFELPTENVTARLVYVGGGNLVTDLIKLD
jgi:ATP-dependent helicase/nuclease subunit A